jgi:signal transduction histidine kinase
VLVLGGERYLSLPAAVSAEWTQRAEAALARSQPLLRERWREAETLAFVSDPAWVQERFKLGADHRPTLPRPFEEAFASPVTFRADPGHEARFLEAEALAREGGEPATGKALQLYSQLQGIVPPQSELSERIALATAALMLRLKAPGPAGAVFELLAKRSAHSAPWVAPFALLRRLECLQAEGKTDTFLLATELFVLGLFDRAGRSHPGLDAERRRFLGRKALSLLERAGAPGRKLRDELRAAHTRSEGEETLLTALRTQVIPWLEGAQLPARRALTLGGARVLALVRASKEGIQGVLVDPRAFRDAVLAPALPLDPSLSASLPLQPGQALAEGELFEGPLSPRLAIRFADPGALEAEVLARRMGLIGLMVLIGGGLLLGNVFVLARLRREVRLSQLKSDLLANVSHDLRTPLAIIRSAAETLQLNRFEGQPEKTERYLWVIVEETIRLDALVANVLDAARIELGRKEYSFGAVSPKALVTDLEQRWRPYLERAGFELVVKCGEAPTIRADSACLHTALSNLIENSMKYSEEVKRIELCVESHEAHVEFSVADRGRGVDERELTRIFERHYRAEASALSSEGLGLGLALVVETARAHGGSVTCEARAEGGSRFALRLPPGEPEDPAGLGEGLVA